jgi:MFS family permease
MSRNVLAFGAASFLTDTASEMAVCLLPLYVVGTLGGGATVLGLVDGVANAVSAVLKLVSGRVADRTGRAKPLVVGGYLLSALARPWLALTGSSLGVMGVRIVDRLGKGLRTSPRDALLASDADDADLGRVFGFHRAMDHLGAVFGPIVALMLLAAGVEDLRVVFASTIVPGLLTVVVLQVFVREDPAPVPEAPSPAVAAPASEGLWPVQRVLLPIGVSGLARAADTLLLLRVGAGAEDPTLFPIAWAAFHVVKVGASGVGGWMTDSFGPHRTLLVGWACFVGSFSWLAFVEDPAWLPIGLLFHGVFDGLSEGPEKAWISGWARAGGRGQAFGRYHLVVGLAGIFANVLVGGLWDAWGPEVGLGAGALVGVLAWVLLASTPARPPATVGRELS